MENYSSDFIHSTISFLNLEWTWTVGDGWDITVEGGILRHVVHLGAIRNAAEELVWA